MTSILTRTPAPGADSHRGSLGAWASGHLLGLHGVSGADLRTVLVRARELAPMAHRSDQKAPDLRGKVVATLFFEDSTRTRMSFTLAAQRLSADVVDLTAQGSSVSKGETLVDTALNVQAMGVDAMVVRARASGAAEMIARAVSCAVINAGDGKHEHPTQGLLDIYTLAEAHGRLGTFDLSGLRVAIVGDVANSRVARSAIAGMTTLGAGVICVGPPGLAPSGLCSLGCEVAHELDPVLADVDAVMMLRIQFERHGAAEASGGTGAKDPALPRASAISSLREYRELYAMTEARAERLKPGAIVMHPGPINRGLELDAAVADGPRSVVLRQVRAGVAVRMAALSVCVENRQSRDREGAGGIP